MALYSWFSRTKTEPNRKTIKVNNDLLRASESVKYIENYTMWPTAKIKQDVQVTESSFDSLDNKATKKSSVALTTKTALIPIET